MNVTLYKNKAILVSFLTRNEHTYSISVFDTLLANATALHIKNNFNITKDVCTFISEGCLYNNAPFW